ncbi:hypothetical protein AVEN_28572-1, partial [Araneus ventricosus]
THRHDPQGIFQLEDEALPAFGPFLQCSLALEGIDQASIHYE